MIETAIKDNKPLDNGLVVIFLYYTEIASSLIYPQIYFQTLVMCNDDKFGFIFNRE